MRIAQIVLPGASEYERKSQRADHAALSERHEVIVGPIEAVRDLQADVAHVYATGDLPAAAFVRFPFPYVASSDVRKSRWQWRHPVPPRRVVSPLAEEPLPEVVEEEYFSVAATRRTDSQDRKIVGSFGRASVRNSVEQTMARIAASATTSTGRFSGSRPRRRISQAWMSGSIRRSVKTTSTASSPRP
jgi:hypothetical protein